jgi:hypothetical protein
LSGSGPPGSSTLQITITSSVTGVLIQPDTLDKSLEEVTKPLTSTSEGAAA